MSVTRSSEDSWTREMAKWEQRPVLVGGSTDHTGKRYGGTYVEPIPFADGGRGGMPFQPYPKMLYKASSEMGGPQISATKIVDSEQAERIAIGQGWSDGQEAAIEAVAERELEMAKLAANRVHNERWMSEASKAHAASVDESTINHVAEIPVAPVKKRGRPAKVS